MSTDRRTFLKLSALAGGAVGLGGVRMAENGTTGVFNATGPRSKMTMAEQLYGIRGARRWGEMTTWFGPRAPISYTSIERAVAAGLTFRPLGETTVDTLAWFQSEPVERQNELRAGLAPEKEAQVLAAWLAAGGA